MSQEIFEEVAGLNYLAHALLTRADAEEQLGSFYADFVRGRLDGLSQKYTDAIVRGIDLHRKTDHFTDQHPIIADSRSLFSPSRRRYSGIILDVLYDHFLHQSWGQFCDTPKRVFIDDFYRLVSSNKQSHPEKLKPIVERLIEHDWLGSYEALDTVGIALDRISTRFKRDSGLQGSLSEIEQNYEALRKGFNRFFPEVFAYANRLQCKN